MRRILLFLALALLARAGAAQVKIKIDAHGRKVLYNDPPATVSGKSPSGHTERADPVLGRAYRTLIARHARLQRLDPKLVEAVIRVESSFDPRARSHRGAMGLMQLMPETARELGVRDAYDPEENIRGGTTYLRAMLQRFGDLELALAGYNAGPTAVEEHGGVPPFEETTRYIQKVLTAYRGSAVSWQPQRRRPVRPVQMRRDENGRFLLTTED